jgi:MFS family permease
LLGIGILSGTGIGLAYVVPIAVCVKWFPDKKGLITGLAVAGFGFGATIWVKLAGSWFGGLINTTAVFGLPGVQSVFVIYGITFTALVLAGSVVMINPPENYMPANWTPPAANDGTSAGSLEFRSAEMLRKPQFYMLWTVFMFSGIAGLMVIYCIKLFGIDALEYRGVIDAGAITGTAMAWYAIFNGLGRIAWGSVSDRIGRKQTIIIMSALQGITMLATYHIFITRRSVDRIQLRWQLCPVSRHHRRLLRQSQCRQQLRLDVYRLRRSRSGRPVTCGLFQGLGRGRRQPDRVDDVLRGRRQRLSAGRARNDLCEAAAQHFA